MHSSYRAVRSIGDDANVNDPSTAVRLEDCLESFIRWENLDNKEMFNCKACKQLKPATKKLDIWKLPPCLVRRHMLVHLVTMPLFLLLRSSTSNVFNCRIIGGSNRLELYVSRLNRFILRNTLLNAHPRDHCHHVPRMIT